MIGFHALTVPDAPVKTCRLQLGCPEATQLRLSLHDSDRASTSMASYVQL